MSSPTPERIHRKKLARLRKRRSIAVMHRNGWETVLEKVDGEFKRIPKRCQPFGFRSAPRK